MRRTVLVSMVAALLAGGPLYAQAGQVTGTVTSSEGARPLSGATVSVAGTQLRAVTGPDGRYTINGVAAGAQRVTASTIGHTAATLPVTVQPGQAATLNFQLAPAAISLEGLVAIGYGEVQARDRTGVVEAVSAEEFNTGRVVSPEQLIQGKVAGVQVIDSGEPGAGVNLRIRGGTSVNASSEPLFVIDGLPVHVGGGISAGRNPLNFLNPNDIESVTVLKDASATAIYGSRGANGVIMIKTKGGARGPRFSYATSLSTSRITGEPDLLNAEQFRAAVQQYAPENLPKLGTASTDWRGAVQRNGTGQEHSLSVAGARDDMSYRFSFGYLDQQGVIRGSETERVSAALNYTDVFFGDRLNVRASVRGARTEDLFTPGAVIGAANGFAPTQPIRTATGDYFEWNSTLGTNNPIAELDLSVDEGTVYRSVGSVEGEYRMPFLDDLTATLRLGYDVTRAERRNFQPRTLQAQRELADPGFVSRSIPSLLNTVLETYLNYQKAFDAIESEIDVTAGYSYETTDTDSSFFRAQGLVNDLLGPNGIPSAELERTFIRAEESRLISGFARVNYSLLDRYLLTLSVRRDGSSRFGPDNQWGWFPSAALAWRLSEESFLQGVDWLSDLKLRASYGVNGNQTFDDYLWISSYEGGNSLVQVQFGDEWVSTIRPSAVDPSIKWEETTSYNLGVDFGVLDGRVTGAVDFYHKDTDDLLFVVPVPAGTNLSNFVLTNIGSVENRGVELTLDADVLRGGERGLRWSANFNAATNRNRLKTINAAQGVRQILTGGISGGVGNNIQVYRPGEPINTFLVYRSKRDAQGRPVVSDNALDMYVDQDGDGEINEDDRVPFHNPAPAWILGHTSQFGYGSADLSFTMRAHLGSYVYNNVASNQGHFSAVRGEAPGNLHASVLDNGFVNPQYFSDVYVEDASFLRLDNLTLGYTFERLRGVDQVRVFGTVQNVFTLTGYSGVDPFAGLGGIDNNIYPRSRTFSLGVNLGF